MTDPRFNRPVVCMWCSNRYRSISPGRNSEPSDTQGDCCAASVWEKDGKWYLQGHYGSTNYDTDRFVFKANAPTAEADPVCDNCIGERIHAGDLERVEGSYP